MFILSVFNLNNQLSLSHTLSTVVPGCNVNGYNGAPHIKDRKLWSRIFPGFCNGKIPRYNGHAYSGNSHIPDNFFGPFETKTRFERRSVNCRLSLSLRSRKRKEREKEKERD